MISACAEWQTSITQSEAGITEEALTALLKTVGQIKQYYSFDAVDMEEQDDE